ncbi:hypothetical protein [Mycolicibacterium grossiae]|uniref:hypothetical protein n=1 Tax=Mycolicibacterium grossiae TaxID=1552759 RepID=UPI0014788815|nr:hypothetical protein [Mycolicibacterium grossiae]
MIDLFTIQQRVGRLDNLRIGVGFDPLHSRSIRSFCLALSKFPNNGIVVVSPEQCAMPKNQVTDLQSRGLTVGESSDKDAMLDREVLYVNRFQKERFADASMVDQFIKEFVITSQDLIEHDAVKHVLDPLPRVGELDTKIDSMKQAAYFEQSDQRRTGEDDPSPFVRKTCVALSSTPMSGLPVTK